MVSKLDVLSMITIFNSMSPHDQLDFLNSIQLNQDAKLYILSALGLKKYCVYCLEKMINICIMCKSSFCPSCANAKKCKYNCEGFCMDHCDNCK